MTNETRFELPAFQAPADQGGHTAIQGPNNFVLWRQIRFGECDPAGIVYYPRYVNMFHEITEDWWQWGLGIELNDMIKAGLGWPMVSLESDFRRPAYAGEFVRFELSIARIGKASLKTEIRCYDLDRDNLRLEARLVHAMLDIKDHRSLPIIAGLRRRLEAFRDGTLEQIDLSQPIPVTAQELE